MKFGFLILGKYAHDQFRDVLQSVVRTGAHTVWLADERFYRSPWPLMTVAAKETDLSVGLMVTDPFIRHPALTLATAATIDEMTSQGIRLGLGSGVSGFREIGIEPKRAVLALRETILMMRSVMRDPQSAFRGELFELAAGAMSLPIRQDIEVLLASNGPATITLAGELADAIAVQGMAHPIMINNVRELVAKGIARSNCSTREVRTIARLDVCIDPDIDAARDRFRLGALRHLIIHAPAFRSHQLAGLEVPPRLAEIVQDMGYGHDLERLRDHASSVPDDFVDRMYVFGDMEVVVERLQSLVEEGVDELAIFPVPSPEQSDLEAIEIIGDAISHLQPRDENT